MHLELVAEANWVPIQVSILHSIVASRWISVPLTLFLPQEKTPDRAPTASLNNTVLSYPQLTRPHVESHRPRALSLIPNSTNELSGLLWLGPPDSMWRLQDYGMPFQTDLLVPFQKKSKAVLLK